MVRMVQECIADTGVNWALWRERPRIATSVLARLAKETDGIKKTLDLLCQMQQQEVETNIFHFSCAISACEKLADWSMALEILRKMKERQVPCNVVSCSSTLSACEKASQWPMALELFQTMTEQQISPNLIALSSTISACEKGGEWQMALELFASAHMDHDVVSYSSMISACAQGGQWQLAVHILQTMTERQTLSSSSCPAICRSRIESCLAENSCNSILEEGQSGTVQLFGEGMTEHVMV